MVDWFNKVKVDIIDLVITSFNLRLDIVYLINTNPNVLYDINLDEKVEKLIDSENITNKYLSDIINKVNDIEESKTYFLYEDLLDQVDYIKDILTNEMLLFIKLSEYLAMIDDYTIQGDDIVKFLEENNLASDTYYENIKMDNKILKKIIQEGRND